MTGFEAEPVFRRLEKDITMRCDEFQEHIVELLYDEPGTPAEIRDHARTCPSCRRELEDLKQTRTHLQCWKDEAPATSLFIAPRSPLPNRASGWKYLRYAAVAALVVISFLALANTQITWTRDEITFSTHLFGRPEVEREYYTKAEMRELVKRALDDTEFRMNETNYLMIQKMMDTVERERWADMHLIHRSAAQIRDNNN